MQSVQIRYRWLSEEANKRTKSTRYNWYASVCKSFKEETNPTQPNPTPLSFSREPHLPLLLGSEFCVVLMGIRFSHSHAGTTPPSTPTLGDLPESCVASILGYMDPPQICKLATLNRTFRAASSADFVWESKLPANYHVLVTKIFNRDFPTSLGKRAIYASLCRLNSLDEGTEVMNDSSVL